MFTLYLTTADGTRDVTQLVQSLKWCGDKASIARRLEVSLLHREQSGWPAPALGDVLTLADGEGTLFTGYAVRRTLNSESAVLSCTCYDRGIYLKNNDGTYKFRRTSPEEICRRVCADYGVEAAETAASGVLLDRKFSGVALDKIISTAYTLAAEQTGERYGIRMMPEGLVVKKLEQSQSSLELRQRSNLIEAATTESIVSMVNSAAIYDQQGGLLQTLEDSAAVALYGRMQKHITQRSGQDAAAQARAALEDGALEQTVTVSVLGDRRLITGETVVVSEGSTGLQGLFWIDADVHTWQRGVYQCKLTLNCRSVMTKTTAGSELT